MSRMGNYNLQLQEIAEGLGFSTTQEALDNGYHVVEDVVTGEATLKKLDEQELAHEAWLEEKHEILHLLESVKEDIVELNDGDNSHVAIDELDRVIDFIEGVSHE